jgi:hypothetical protein
MLHGGANYSELIEILRLLREIGHEAKELVTLDDPNKRNAECKGGSLAISMRLRNRSSGRDVLVRRT